ncbi:efflux transporter outer membrane subunit [Bradyrhizobium canariense]|uniref:Efflux transporter, outer membrane factor (OMF) lipoprotein, NodT family n=1 Tax=Bradyrhizobium canariense TaxID=255045 RepID=A0A1H1UDH4_9BRAD|nr:efflux transporter outer membrane subunit [Bradyrhizobium canariense]SDS70535.1 efflux transporter, outer membrane factor (OMF) lipoprotein, NodT family [Bradyrhizobium canariense]
MKQAAGRIRRARTRYLVPAALQVAIALSAASCAVGPNFVRPAAPDVAGYVPGKLQSPTSERSGPRVAAQHFVTGEDISARWWAAFKSKPLNDLIKDSVDHNPNLQAAEAAIKVAQFNAQAQRGLFYPQLTGNSTSADYLISNPGQVPPIPTPGPQSQYTLVTNQLTVTFVPDIWGANLRAVQNLDAVTEQQLFQLEAAYLSLTSNVVTAAIQEASLRGQLEATKRIIAIERNLLGILKRQFDAGQVAQADVLAQDAALAQAEQLLPPLEKQLAQQRDLLTALAGRLSADEIAQKFELAYLKLPANLPVSLPSTLVNQRPDVRAAEANMHSASAQVGVAIAARLPNIELSANGGSTAYNIAQSFAPGTGFYTLVASTTAPIFDGFTLYNKQKAAEAALEQAEAQYRSTVIAAFQNVADALRAVQTDARAAQASVRAEVTAKASLDIVQKQLDAGQVNQLAVLNAQQTYLTASLSRVQAEANRLADTAALFMALGGGWPASCSTPVWRQCAMGEEPVVASSDQHQPQ